MGINLLLGIIGTILGIIGTMIAFSVAVVTIWQGFLMRRHNRLSVRPMLRIDRYTVLGEKVGISIRNTGVGPAIIKSIEYVIDEFSDTKKYSNGNDVIINLDLEPEIFRIFYIYPDESLSSGEYHFLFETLGKIENKDILPDILNAFNRLSIKVLYQSIYEEQFTLFDSRKLKI